MRRRARTKSKSTKAPAAARRIHWKAWSVGGALLVGGLSLVFMRERRSPATHSASAPKPPASAPSPAERARERLREGARDAARLMTPAERERAYLRCLVDIRKEDECAGILEAAASDAEQIHLLYLATGRRIRQLAIVTPDGEVALDTAKDIASALQGTGLGVFATFQKATPDEISKDPASARGKVVSVEGSVVEAHADGAHTLGTLRTRGGALVYFRTPFPVDRDAGALPVRFTGVFVQRYLHPTNKADAPRMVLVGAFASPADANSAFGR